MGLTDGPDILGHKIAWEGIPQFLGDASRARAALRETRMESIQAGRSMDGLGAELGKLALKIAAPIAGFQAIKAALTAGAEGARAMGQLGTSLGGASRAAAMYGDRIDAMARKVGISDDALAIATKSVLQLGVAQQDAMGFLETSAETAQGTYQDLGAVIEATASVMHNFDMTAADSSRIQNVLFQGVKRGAGSFQELGDFLGQNAALMKSFGLGLEDTVAMAGTLGQAGIKGQRALMSVATIMQALVKPSEEAAAEADRLNLAWNLASFRGLGFERWLQTVGERLQEAARGGNDTVESLTKLGLQGRPAGAFQALLSGAERYRDILHEIRNTQDETGALAGERLGSPEGMALRYKATTEQLWEQFGQGIMMGVSGADADTAIEDLAKNGPALVEMGRSLGDVLRQLGEVLISTLPPLTAALEALANADEWIEEKTGASALAGVAGGALAWKFGGKALWTALRNQAAARGAAAAAGAGAGMGGAALAEGISTISVPLAGQAATAGAGAIDIGAQAAPGFWSRTLGAVSRLRPLPLGTKAIPVLGQVAMALDSTEVANAELSPEQRASIANRPLINWYGRLFDEMGVSLEERLLGQSVPGIVDTMDRELTKFGVNLGDDLGTRLAALAGDLPSVLAERMAARLASAAEMRKGDEAALPIVIDLKQKYDFSFGDKKESRSSSHRVAGAGNAEIHHNYAFMVLREGQGIAEVRPMQEHVAFGHIRGGG